MTYTINVTDEINEKFLWLLHHFDGEIEIISENGEVVPDKDYFELREKAMKDYDAGETVSLDDFDKEMLG